MDGLDFPVTVLVACLFGYLGFRMKLPAGAMIGSVLGVALLQVLFDRAYFYQDLRVVIQLVSGAMIGSRIGRKDFLSLRSILLPTCFMLGCMLVLNLGFGLLMHVAGGLDIATALFASAPGGMADMALISADLGATTAYVGLLQMFRILVIILTLPGLFKQVLRKQGYRGQRERLTVSADVEDPAAPQSAGTPFGSQSPYPWARLTVLIACSTAGGLLFRWLGITAGALTGGMIGSALYCVLRGKVPFPNGIKFLLQIMAGVYIGIGIDRASVATMPALVLPAVIMLAGIYAFVFSTAWLLQRLFGLDPAVSLLASAPGGVQEMSLLSEELGADTAKVAVMQTIRLMFVILVFPTMLGLVTAWVGQR